jgi:hypothetical protein
MPQAENVIVDIYVDGPGNSDCLIHRRRTAMILFQDNSRRRMLNRDEAHC